MLYLGADHRGYNLKENLKEFLQKEKIIFQDLGNQKYDPNDDYPDFAQGVAKKVSLSNGEDKGILICGSGIGMSIAANRFPLVRAGLCLSEYMAKRAKEEDDINILCLAADITDSGLAERIVQAWYKTDFLQKERYKRRIKKIN